jgi:hypothetical protein
MIKPPTTQVKGLISDKDTREGLPFADIFLSDKDGKMIERFGVASEEDGKYVLEIPLPLPSEPTKYLTADYVGYGKITRPFERTRRTYNFRLSMPVTTLPEVVIMPKDKDVISKIHDGFDLAARRKRRNKALIIAGIGVLLIGGTAIAYKYGAFDFLKRAKA